MYKEKYLEDLKRINNDLRIGQANIDNFDLYLESIKDLGSFSSQTWPAIWREEVYRLGKNFEKANPDLFFKKLSDFKIKYPENKEVYDFIHSEIIWCFFETENTYQKDLLRELIEEYPTNPEFHHTYSHFLGINKSHEKALFECRTALKLDPGNQIFLKSLILKVKDCFDDFISSAKIDKAENLLSEQKDILSEYRPADIFNYLELTYTLSSLNDRLRDHKAINLQVEYFKKEIENTIRSEQKRLIEILGIFSAVLGFILTNITIAISEFSFSEMLILMFGMSLVLIIFAISISLLFSPRYRHADYVWFLKRGKLHALILLIIVLLTLYYFSL